jgi:hypothetical protein
MPRVRPQLLNYEPMREIVMPQHQRYMRLRSGSFSKVSSAEEGTWQASDFVYCREYFLDESPGIRRMLFYHKKNKSYNIASFMHQIERKLHVQPRTRFGPTQRATVTWIQVSPFWSTTAMKRSLFTALLRCGANYCWTKNNFDEALISIQYTRGTQQALRRFLSGYTRYTGKQKGWYSQFRWGAGPYYRPEPPSPEHIRKLLVRPMNDNGR